MNERFAAFLRVLDPEDNITGGGAAAAIGGAMGAGLVGMVARLSVGKKNMPDPDLVYQEIDHEIQELVDLLITGSNQDSIAFDRVMEAYRMPKSDGHEQATRSQAIQLAMVGATEIPLQNASSCARVLELAAKLEGRSNQSATSDLECGILLARAGLEGALSNASTNIASLKDPVVAAGLAGRVEQIKTRLI